MATSVSGNLRFVPTYQEADAWVALADRTRRSIVERLAHGPLAVGELARDMPVSRPAVSQHLKVLKRAGLVRDRAAGTRRVYQLDPTGLEALRADLDRFWMLALAGFKDTVERLEGDES
jgi:DNA-binding transcriptional ArsR family regulator